MSAAAVLQMCFTSSGKESEPATARQKQKQQETGAAASIISERQLKTKRRIKRMGRPRPTKTYSSATATASSRAISNQSTYIKRFTSQLHVSMPPVSSQCADSDDDDDTTHSSLCVPIATRDSAIETAKAAIRAVRDTLDNSQVLSSSSLDGVPRLDVNEICIGKRLGRGGFSDVLEISHITPISSKPSSDGGGATRQHMFEWGPSFLSSFSGCDAATPTDQQEDNDDAESDDNNNTLHHQENSRHRLANISNTSTTGSHLCVKILSTETLKCPDMFRVGATDLAVEAAFLASLDHPNIIRLRGLSSLGPRGFASGIPSGYFLVMDRLYSTLDDRIQDWKVQGVEEGLTPFGAKTISTRLRNKISRGKRSFEKCQAALIDRLRIAPDIASALSYLHSKGIIYRDLKTSNVGFTHTGRIQLFDFGLAKEVNCLDGGNDGTYLLSGNTGSPRFMAPEVSRHEPYNFSADCYSYTLLLWQILTLSKPYEGMNRQTHAERVIYGTERPHLPTSWPTPLLELLKSGWHPSLHRRPSMKTIHNQVCLVLGSLDGSSTEMMNFSTSESLCSRAKAA